MNWQTMYKQFYCNFVFNMTNHRLQSPSAHLPSWRRPSQSLCRHRCGLSSAAEAGVSAAGWWLWWQTWHLTRGNHAGTAAGRHRSHHASDARLTCLTNQPSVRNHLPPDWQEYQFSSIQVFQILLGLCSLRNIYYYQQLVSTLELLDLLYLLNVIKC